MPIPQDYDILLESLFSEKLSKKAEPEYDAKKKRISSEFRVPPEMRLHHQIEAVKEFTKAKFDVLVESAIETYQHFNKCPDDETEKEISKRLDEIIESVELHLPSAGPFTFDEQFIDRHISRLKQELRGAAGSSLGPLRTIVLKGKIAESLENQNKILITLYNLTINNLKAGIDVQVLDEKAGLEKEAFESALRILVNDGLVNKSNLRVNLTPSGKTQTEERLKSKPTEPASTSQPTVSQPDFSFIADNEYRRITERDYKELSGLNPYTSPKSVLVLSGGIIEGILIDALTTLGDVNAKESYLKDLIVAAKNTGIIQHDNITGSLRVFRNIVHPAREISTQA
ncbi:MAG TPA: hypothetical protein VFD58_32325 [Blastocatellia bacterium]|nr:hypothetical protein [Blastocatellia bacterium]